MKKLLFAAVMLLMVVTGCKPTERGYKAAYDAALAKREKAQAESMLPASGLLSDDGPQPRVLDGDTVFVTSALLKFDDGAVRPMYNVAVALYKMNTNARSMATDLKSKGYDAVAAQARGGKWYTVAGAFTSLTGARDFILKFRKDNPGFRYIGLPGAPVVIRAN